MTMPTVGMTGNFKVPKPANEPPRSYAPRSPEANAVLHRIQELSHHVRELPHVIGGQRRMTEETWDVAAPHDHHNVIARMLGRCSSTRPPQRYCSYGHRRRAISTGCYRCSPSSTRPVGGARKSVV